MMPALSAHCAGQIAHSWPSSKTWCDSLITISDFPRCTKQKLDTRSASTPAADVVSPSVPIQT